MFTFQRISSRPAETWTITLAEGVVTDAPKRFGKPLKFNGRTKGQGPSRFHDIGVLMAIDGGDGDTEFLLACRDGLTSLERGTLMVELEMLLGKSVHRNGAEETRGWFIHDALGP
jgi:hypothetical protein